MNITNGNEFFNNLATEKGDDLYTIKTKNKVYIDVASFRNPSAKNSIYAENVQFEIKTTTLSNMKNKDSMEGGGIHCMNCFSILIDTCTFEDLHSELGGAIYI